MLPGVFPDPVQPVDHRQAEAVEGHHQRKYYRIGIFCAEAQHHVEREGGCGEQARLEPEIGIERLLLVHAHQGVGADADGEGQHQQDQFDIAPRLGCGIDGCHWPTPQTGAEGDGVAVPAAPGLAVAPGLAAALGVAGVGEGVMHSSAGAVVPVRSRFLTIRWAS